MKPAEIVIEQFGVRPLARMLSISPSTIIRWRERGGIIPVRYIPKLMELGEGKLSYEDLIEGR